MPSLRLEVSSNGFWGLNNGTQCISIHQFPLTYLTLHLTCYNRVITHLCFLIFLVKLKDGSFYLSVHCMCKQAFPFQYESTISNQEISTSTRTALLSFKWAEWKHTKWVWVLNSGWHICKGPDRQTRFLSNVYENWESHRVWRYLENKSVPVPVQVPP